MGLKLEGLEIKFYKLFLIQEDLHLSLITQIVLGKLIFGTYFIMPC